MKTGQVLKAMGQAEVTEEELRLINRYTRRIFQAEEVYVFSVVLCDNDVDRDFERFTVEALFELEKLFVGKTSVFDHEPKAENQTARIFSCKVEAVAGKQTQTGDEYFRLIARAYLPRCEKNNDFILLLDSGIQKEVSIGCSVGKHSCSICGQSVKSGRCGHKKGNIYNSKLCYGELSKPCDAYEWSFVAVPAQRQAGVIKSYQPNNRKDMVMEDILKSIRSGESVSLTQKQAEQLGGYLEQLEKQALQGELYKNDLQNSVLKLSMIVQPEISKATMTEIVTALGIERLKELQKVYEKKAADLLPPTPQLAPVNQQGGDSGRNVEFKI